MKKKRKISLKDITTRKNLIIFDKIISVIVIVLIGFLKPDSVLIFTFIMLIPYLIITRRKNALVHLFISLIIAVIWTFIAKDFYHYNIDMITVKGLNLYPVFAWSLGLLGIYMIYSHWEHILKKKTLIRKVLLFILFYFPMLIFVETIAYHLFNIKDIATAGFPGLPLCDCLHAPTWMQISYFFMGPFYLMVCNLLGLENPHKKDNSYLKKRRI